jgi:two-component system cell cycle response regulator
MPVIVPPAQARIAEYMGSEAERPFIHKAYARSLGDEDRLRYAQLVEATDPERAEWLRLEVALHARAADDPAVIARFLELAHIVGLDFANLLLREAIMNCGGEGARAAPPRVRFAFACTKRWETLAPTGAGSVRFCQQCKESVYYCDTVADAESRALAGQCIAVPKRLADDRSGGARLGRPAPVRDWASRLFSLGPGARDLDLLIVIYSGDPELDGKCYALKSSPTTVGRGLDNTIVMRGDAVSRSHARFEWRADRWWVVDGGSTNGTYVNDEQVREAALRQGDRIRIGGTILRLDDSPPVVDSGYTMTSIDGLTGLSNRRHLLEQIARELRGTDGAGRPPALALFDIDRFKILNDSHGHLAGDQVLREIAGLMRPHARERDVLARFSGDRFALLLPATDLEGASAIAAKIRAEIADHAFTVGETTISATVSAGVACAGVDDPIADALIRAADQQLYAAKRAARGLST